ncbi:MAG: L-threonylcarbamoyladenylate synthase [Planctomycetota bacterium]|jgi:L-threonylcarbamoyladenylate synthase
MKPQTGSDLQRAARLLAAGDVVGVPTETVYGLAANAFDPAAVARVFEVKRRPSFDPLIVHVRDPQAALEVATHLPPAAERLAEAFWPGPLTMVLERRDQVPDLVTSGLPTVGVRCPRHPLIQELLAALDFPLAAPSANRFGSISPTTAQHVLDQLGEDVPYVLDGGPCTVGVESTIVGFRGERCLLYRPGGVPLEELEELVGPIEDARQEAPTSPVTPGMLPSHYAPRTPLELGDLDALLERHAGRRLGVLCFQRERKALGCRVLSPRGDLSEAAQRLFAALRELDASGAELLLAEPVPELGLGRAINDRLRRAAR